MKTNRFAPALAILSFLLTLIPARAQDQSQAQLPQGVRAVWNLDQAQRAATTTREQVCLNGLWRWQPGKDTAETVPDAGWGFFKVPGCWPGTTDYLQKDCQTVYAHPSWQGEKLGGITTAWYQREITIPKEWDGHRITLTLEYLNSFRGGMGGWPQGGRNSFSGRRGRPHRALPTRQPACPEFAGRSDAVERGFALLWRHLWRKTGAGHGRTARVVRGCLSGRHARECPPRRCESEDFGAT